MRCGGVEWRYGEVWWCGVEWFGCGVTLVGGSNYGVVN